MSDNPPPESSIILYQTEDGGTRIECRFESDTIWLTQALIAERADSARPDMGLTAWKSGVVRKGDVTVAKNYLRDAEINGLNRIVASFR